MAIYSVSQITQHIKESLDRDSQLSKLWVEGEVSNLSESATGTTYFTLNDKTTQLKCVMFANADGQEFLENGKAVVADGRISFYEARGQLQLYINLIQPSGIGEKQLELEKVRLQLEKEGLFDESRKRPIPPFPERIGVITSPFGSVWHDIQNIVKRRYPVAELILAPAKVQGEEAEKSIIDALGRLHGYKSIDVIIIARGGGAAEELAPFNQETVARAIYKSVTPIVSGIGHETDYTLSDMVADVRAPTPSTAAELVVPNSIELIQSISVFMDKISRHMQFTSSEGRVSLERLIYLLNSHVHDIEGSREKISSYLHRATTQAKNQFKLKIEMTKRLSSNLSTLKPDGILNRGYAILQKQSNAEVISGVSQVDTGDIIVANVRDGSFTTKVIP